MQLDYTLTTHQRLTLLKNLESDNILSTLTPSQLEFLTNYLLHQDRHDLVQRGAYTVVKRTSHKPTSRLEHLRTTHESTDTLLPHQELAAEPTRYTKPKFKPDYSHPAMADFKLAITQLKQLRDTLTGPDQWKAKKWLVETYLDAGIAYAKINPAITFSVAPTQQAPQPLDQIDLTDAFHIKHIIEYYSLLRQDGGENARWLVDYFEKIVEQTPLTQWQYDLVVMRCEKRNSAAIATFMAEHHQKYFSPQSLSNSMRAIYRLIADYAANHHDEWQYRNNPDHWKTCRKCGTTKINSTYNFHKGRNECKTCRSVKRDKPRNIGETNV